MNAKLLALQELIEKKENISSEEKEELAASIKTLDKEITIIEFKLERTDKVKRTTSILLEETIEELELKRKAIEESNDALQKSLLDLKAAQAQLIQSEKMASLGELTAGIAHEIQNPLNFVNNFAEVSAEMLEEIKEEIDNKEYEEVKNIANDLKRNLEKITHHGKRAESIVKGMLQHSRVTQGERVPTDINSLCDEFLRLSYHGLRAKNRTFNSDFETHFDESIPKIELNTQDIGRVILNLINNAFQAVAENPEMKYENRDSPKVIISTKNLGDKIVISVADNGPGIPVEIKDKIFQPFFTTKPTGQGTGLGLSLAYDIVKAHGGELKVSSTNSMGTCFTVILPK
jgi:signal transduction histidine kinase